MAHPPAQPHDQLTEVFPDVFVVRGTMRFMPGFSIPRNMTVLRQGDELTLLNSVRLDESGLAALDALGKVKHLVRVGSLHGLDDPFYRERYAPRFWAPPGVQADEALPEGPTPFGQSFLFSKAKEPEAAVILPGEVLVTCDSLQNWTEPSFEQCSWIGRQFMRRSGFRPNLIGPFWLKRMGRAVQQDFERLAELPFRHGVSGHGTPYKGDAQAGLRAAIQATFA